MLCTEVYLSPQGVASGNLQWDSLLQAHVEAIPQSIPIIALAFVYQVSLSKHLIFRAI